MNASVDTDIIIHLYSSKHESLLYNFFDNLYIYEYLVETELRKVSSKVYSKFLSDVNSKNVSIVTDIDLVKKGMKPIFDRYVSENEILFDQGELYAIALAKTLGLPTLLTDDTKEFGPHRMLVKELIEEVFPLTFYELLFLEFITGRITVNKLHSKFELINKVSMQNPMSFRSKILETVKRFSYTFGTDRDFEWINNYCKVCKIDYAVEVYKLEEYLRSNL